MAFSAEPHKKGVGWKMKEKHHWSRDISSETMVKNKNSLLLLEMIKKMLNYKDERWGSNVCLYKLLALRDGSMNSVQMYFSDFRNVTTRFYSESSALWSWA